MNRLLKLSFALVLGLASLTGCGDEEYAEANYREAAGHVFHFFLEKGRREYDLGEISVEEVLAYSEDDFAANVLNGTSLEDMYPYYTFKNITFKNGSEYVFDTDSLNTLLNHTEPDVKFGFLWQQYCWHIFINYTPTEYSIQYLGYDDGFEGMNSYSIENQFDLPTIDVEEHQTFEGWVIQDTDTVITSTPDENLTNLVLAPKSSNNIYSVTYDLPLDITNNNPKSFTYYEDEKTLIPFADDPTGAYTFDGFYLDNEQITKLDPKIGKNITIECRFTFTEYTAKYYVGDELKFTNKFTAATLKDYTEPEIPGKDHYTARWSEKVTQAKNYEINAIYSAEQYTVTINTGIDGYTVSPKKYTYGENKKYQDVADQLSYTDKALVGLYSDSEYKTAIGLNTLIDKDITVYAKWDTLIKIATAEDWAKIAQTPSGHFLLTADISFKAGEIPVVDNFTGSLDGQGHKVQRFTVSNTSCSATYGIFKTNSGRIENITFEDGTFVAKNANGSGSCNIGFLCGVNKGTIKNVDFVGVITTITTNSWINIADFQDHTSYLYAGLCSGLNEGTIENISIDNACKSTYKTIIGYLRDAGRINNGFVMYGYVYQGQITGGNKGTIKNVTVNGDMILNSITLDEQKHDMYDNTMNGGCRYYTRVGGVAGYNSGNGVISKSISNINVKCEYVAPSSPVNPFAMGSCLGGIVGINDADVNSCQTLKTALITNNSSGNTETGGIAGRQEVHAKMKACYSECKFAIKNGSGEIRLGGVVGKNQATISYCWADLTSVDFTGSANSRAGGIGSIFGYSDDTSTTMSTIGSINLDSEVTLVNCYDVGSVSASANLIKVSVYAPTQSTTINAVENDSLASVSSKAKLYEDAEKYYFDEAGFELFDNKFPTISGLGKQELD